MVITNLKMSSNVLMVRMKSSFGKLKPIVLLLYEPNRVNNEHIIFSPIGFKAETLWTFTIELHTLITETLTAEQMFIAISIRLKAF